MFDWIVGVIEAGGYLGLFGLMVLENLFPPIPSELIMPLAGFLSARGELHPAGVIAAGTLGSVVGALPWYWLGRHLGPVALDVAVRRFGVILTLDAQDVATAQRWFERHGPLAVLIGRLIPGVRTLISAPAGLVKMRMGLFLALTTAGSLAWVSLLTASGYLLNDQYHRVERFLDPATTIVFGGVIAVYLVRVVTRLWKARRA